MTCSKCFHEKENHPPTKEGFCNGSLSCMCNKYEEPISEFVNEINRSLATHTSIEGKVKYLLVKIPTLRNAGEKSFARAYKKLVHGFGPTKDGEKLTTKKFKEMPHDDSINRAKRKIQQHHELLASYNVKVINMKGATQEGIMEWLAVE